MRWITLLFALYSLTAVAADSLPAEPAANENEPALAAPTPIERPALRSRHQLELQRLQSTFAAQFKPLSSEHDTAGALYLPANHSTAKGLVVLLPGSGQTADDAFNIDALRQTLTNASWHTLSLQMPEPPFHGLHITAPSASSASTPSTESATQTDEPLEADEAPADERPETATDAANDSDDADTPTTNDNTPPMPEYGARMLALLDAAIEMARQDSPAKLVLLGQAEGAYWVSLWLAEQDPSTADALILLHAQQPATATQTLPDITGPMKLPIFDLFAAQSVEDSQAARQRLNSSSRNADNQYRQTALHEPAQVLRQSELVRRVKGWLSKL